ncbi:MAG: hypothetical protein GX641_02760 [Mollicutes bacterium]|nr:hypothetical protein [Mollicutes bacterium]
MKNYKVGIILGTLSIISTLMIVRLPIGDKMVAIGFLPGMILSIVGIILTKSNKEKYKLKVSLILNTIAIILSVISLILGIVNGFIVNT